LGPSAADKVSTEMMSENVAVIKMCREGGGKTWALLLIPGIKKTERCGRFKGDGKQVGEYLIVGDGNRLIAALFNLQDGGLNFSKDPAVVGATRGKKATQLACQGGPWSINIA